MTQGALGHIVGDGQLWIGQDIPDGIPIIEQFPGQASGFIMWMVSVLFAQFPQLGQFLCELFRQV